MACRSQDRYEEALVQYEKCKEVFVAVHGHDHLDVANSYMDIGNVYNSQKTLSQTALSRSGMAAGG